MDSKAKILGHPMYPMLIAYPIAFYTGTLVGLIIYAVTGSLFWLQLTITLNVAAVVMALLAAIPGFIDWAMGVPNGTSAKRTGLIHMVLNVAALALFIVSCFAYYAYWSGPAGVNPTLGIVLTGIGVALTVAAGFQGWSLVQDHHLGVTSPPDSRRSISNGSPREPTACAEPHRPARRR